MPDQARFVSCPMEPIIREEKVIKVRNCPVNTGPVLYTGFAIAPFGYFPCSIGNHISKSTLDPVKMEDA